MYKIVNICSVCIYVCTIPKVNSIIPRSHIKRLTVTFYMLNNGFSNTQLSFAFVPQKDSCYVHDDTEFLFHFLLQKDIDVFHVLLFGAFPCVFGNSHLSFLYM